MIMRVAHILLALLVLTQSVSMLAFALPVPEQGDQTSLEFDYDSPSQTLSMSRHGAQKPCHQEVVISEADSTKSCCETMDEASCILSCSSIATAFSYPSMLSSLDIHALYPEYSGYSAPHQVLDELYRPPRIS